MLHHEDTQQSTKERVTSAINEALKIYINRLRTGYYEFGLEATFQMHFSLVLEEVLKTKTFSPTERYMVMPEKNFPINGNKDYIDIVIQHTDNAEIESFLIELKYKKKSDGAPNLGNIEAYIDIYNLEQQLANREQNHFGGAYFIFMTSHEAYLRDAQRSITRNEMPMYDGYSIEPNVTYNVTTPSARKRLEKYPNGFVFSKDYRFVYTQFMVDNQPYWYYMQEIGNTIQEIE